MTLSLDVLLIIVAILGTGCGVSVGWVLCEKHRKANPEGIAKVAAAATAQIDMARTDASREVARAREMFDETKAMLVDQVAAWQVHAGQVARLLATPPAAPKPDSPPEPPRVLNPDQSAARVTGEGVTPETELREKLMSQSGLSAEQAEAVIAGKLDNLPQQELMDNLVDGMIRERTGVT